MQIFGTLNARNISRGMVEEGICRIIGIGLQIFSKKYEVGGG